MNVVQPPTIIPSVPMLTIGRCNRQLFFQWSIQYKFFGVSRQIGSCRCRLPPSIYTADGSKDGWNVDEATRISNSNEAACEPDGAVPIIFFPESIFDLPAFLALRPRAGGSIPSRPPAYQRVGAGRCRHLSVKS